MTTYITWRTWRKWIGLGPTLRMKIFADRCGCKCLLYAVCSFYILVLLRGAIAGDEASHRQALRLREHLSRLKMKEGAAAEVLRQGSNMTPSTMHRKQREIHP